MAVSREEKSALNGMWDEAKATGGNCPFPEGVFQFKIMKSKYNDEKKPCVVSTLKCIGGDDEVVGETGDIRDNLESKDNMGWFKSKLARLNVEPPDSFKDISDGTVCKQMVGICFEGQVKIKNGFMNVYVNRLLDGDEDAFPADAGEAEEPDTTPPAKEEEEPEAEAEAEAEAGADEIEVGDLVTWTRKSGAEEKVEVTKVDNDAGKAVIDSKADSKKYKVALDTLAIIYAADDAVEEPEAEEEAESEEEETGGEEEVKLPNITAIKGMKSKQLADLVFTPLGVDIEEVENPRPVALTLARLAKDGSAKLKPSEVKEAAAALGVKVKKGMTPTKVRDAVVAKLEKKLS